MLFDVFIIIFVFVDYFRKFRNRFICRVELVSALDDGVFPVSQPEDNSAAGLEGYYNGVYFTINSINLTSKSKTTAAGVAYTHTLEFSFPNFPEAGDFQMRFRRLAAIRLTLNTGGTYLLQQNDVSLNRTMDTEIQATAKTIGFSTSLTSIWPLPLDEL